MQEPNSTERQAPPPPEHIVREEPEMSEVATLGNIFFDPGSTFEDLRRKPRFILATVIVSLLMTAYGFGLYYKFGDKGVREFILEQIEKSPQAGSMKRRADSTRRTSLPWYASFATARRTTTASIWCCS